MGEKVVVLHSEVKEGATMDEEDVLVQVEAVSEALLDLGYRPVAVPFTLDTRRVLDTAAGAAFVFNLVETVQGSGRLIHLAPSLLEHAGVPFTGNGSRALFLTSNKVAAKRCMRWEGLPTPEWFVAADLSPGREWLPRTCIVKSVWEHASIGLDDASVVRVDSRESLLNQLLEKRARRGGEWFAESYVEGREFNVSVLESESGLHILPPAEIVFSGFPPGRARILGYRAKWDSRSFEYLHAERSFKFAGVKPDFQQELEDLVRRCWDLFGLRGYARVDFRVDDDAGVWILEVNANPCLSPDAGFAAACDQAGLSYKRLVERIVAGRHCVDS